jgi:3-deoxy-D-manno-octulosonate 8-phosphate phosphatase (KDO 8-P phosphatase)
MDLAPIELIILDVDGVLTTGHIINGPEGDVSKPFHVQDGCAIKLWQRSGGAVAILSGRRGEALTRRAEELDIKLVYTGVANKLSGYTEILAAAGTHDEAVCYVGDDIPDLPPMVRARFPVAVADAVPAVKKVAEYVSRRGGGRGAVAEVVELILRKQKRWSRDLLAQV